MNVRWPSALAAMLLLGSPAALACDGRDGGPSGGDYGHGQGGDQDGRDNCHSFCGNVIVVPSPVPGGKNG